MEAEVCPGPGSVLIRIERLDSTNAAAERRRLRSPPPGRDVVIDLSDVVALDPAGLGVLAGAILGVHERGRRVVLVAGPSVEASLEAAGFRKIVPIHRSRPEAIACLSPTQPPDMPDALTSRADALAGP